MKFPFPFALFMFWSVKSVLHAKDDNLCYGSTNKKFMLCLADFGIKGMGVCVCVCGEGGWEGGGGGGGGVGVSESVNKGNIYQKILFQIVLNKF